VKSEQFPDLFRRRNGIVLARRNELADLSTVPALPLWPIFRQGLSEAETLVSIRRPRAGTLTFAAGSVS
jgi:hypothetical protein